MTAKLLKEMEGHNYFKTLMDAPLAAPSKKQYRHKLLGLVEMMNKPFDWIIDHPHECVEAVKDVHQAEQTQKAYIAAVKAMFKYNDDIRCKHPGKHEEWHKVYAEVDDKITQRYIDQKATTKDNENWVTWDKVLEKEQELAKASYASKDHLLLAMYCLIEPLRQDFGAVKICTREPKNKDEGNYMVLTKTNPRLVLNEYKTAKSYGKMMRKLPKNLVDIIKASLEKTPRDYLFADTEGKPYKDNSYTRFANRTLEKLFDKNFTVSMMRHSHINTIDGNNTRQVFDAAKNMGHSVEQQMLYRKQITPTDSASSANGKGEDK
jgi:hypothetical protein